MANKLAYYLRRTPAHEVYVRFDQVEELIGIEKANELAEFVTKKSEVRKGRLHRRSAIKPEKRVSNESLAGYNRIKLLEAIEEAQGKSFQIDGTEPKEFEYKGAPNPDLVPDALHKDLKARGIPEYQD